MKDPVDIAHDKYHDSMIDITQEVLDEKYEQFLCKLVEEDVDSRDRVIDISADNHEVLIEILLANDDEGVLYYANKLRDIIKESVVGVL